MQPIFMNAADSCYAVPQYDIMPMSGGGVFPSIFMGQLNPFLFAQNAFRFGGMNWGGNGLFNSWGNMGWGNPGNMVCNFWSPNFQCGGGVSISSSSSSSSSSSTSKAGKDKYDSLKKLLDSYVAYRIKEVSDDSYKSDISEIAKSKDSYIEKYEKLKEIYDEISKSDKYETFLKEKAASIKFSNGESLEDTLIEIGNVKYEDAATYAGGIIDGKQNHEVNKLFEKREDSNEIINEISAISNYNTNKNMNFISKLAEKYNSATDDVKKEYEAVIRKVTGKLIEEAKKTADNLETNSKFYDKLNKMEITSNGKVTKPFIEEFNRVYAYTRVLKAKAVDKMYARTFGTGEITMFADAAVKALKEESGIDSKDVDAANQLKVSYSASLNKSKTPAAKSVKEYQKNNDAQSAIDIMTDKNEVLAPVEETITVIGTDGTKTQYEKRYKMTLAPGDAKLGIFKQLSVFANGCIPNYIVVTTDEGTEIHKIVQLPGGEWKDTGKVEDWQKLNVELADAKKKIADKRAENETKNSGAEAEDKKEKEIKLMDAAFEHYTDTKQQITIGGVSYNVYSVEPNNSYEKALSGMTGGKLLYYIRDNKIYQIRCKTGSVTFNNDGSIKVAKNTELLPLSTREYKDLKAITVAKYIRSVLNGNTDNEEEWKPFTELLQNDPKTIEKVGGKLTEENIMYMIKYYNENYGKETLFHHIMWENMDDSAQMCMILINLVLKYVENHGGKEMITSGKAQDAVKILEGKNAENILSDYDGRKIDEYLKYLTDYYFKVKK